MRNYRIYQYTFPDGKIYIGITKQTMTERHSSGYYHNPTMQEAIWEYGWKNIQTEVLFDHLTKREAEKKETVLIRERKSYKPEIGYNILIGRKKVMKC